jgi:broad specificity phosphatase PhoE
MRMLLALLLSLPFGPGPALVASDTIVVVVRHAEKATDDPRDPNLSEAGQARAAALAKALADYPLTSAFVTEYKRTQQTADPAAREHQIAPTILPVGKDKAEAYAQRFAALVRREHLGKALLVVGHSNTVPAIVQALGGVQISPIEEATEFNRIYIITLPSEGRPRVIAAKY